MLLGPWQQQEEETAETTLPIEARWEMSWTWYLTNTFLANFGVL